MTPVVLGDSVWLHFGTSSPTTGAATNADSTPTVNVDEDGTALGYAPTVTNVSTGLYKVQVDATGANGFEVGRRYGVYVSATVGGINGKDGLGEFEVLTTSLDTVSSRVDAAISTRLASASYTAPDNASITTILADTNDIQTRLPAALVSGRMDSSVGAIANDAITASALATSAVDEIVDQVWDEALSGHATVGSTGAALSAAGGSGDPWATALPGAYGAGTAGNIIGNNINATVSSRATQVSVDAIQADTDNIQTRLPAALVSGRMDSSVGAMATDTLTAAALATDAVTEIQAGLSTLTQANIRTAVGLAAANLDTQLSTIDSNVDAILDDTGTAGVIVATNNDKTGYSIGVGGIGATSMAADSLSASALSQAAAQEIADEVLNRNIAGGGSGNTRNVRNALRAIRNKQNISGGTLTVYQEDDSTTAWTAAVTTTAGNPISDIDPA